MAAEPGKDHGIEVLHTPKETPIVQIVFVHGLFGHRRKTWTSPATKASRNRPAREPVFWPKDLLPSKTPDALICTWGYDASIDVFLGSASNNSIQLHAKNLVADVINCRKDTSTQELMIIFVAFSMGGIVVKSALNQSSHNVNKDFGSISSATLSVLFLGTPHRGSSSASLGEVAYSIRRAIGKRPNLSVLRALRKSSPELEDISKTFQHTRAKHKIHVASFSEEHETRKLFFFSQTIVEHGSATIGDIDENTGTIPSNHHNMVIYADGNEAGYSRLTSQLNAWIASLREVSSAEPRPLDNVIASLQIDATRFRVRNVVQAHRLTFDWLFDQRKVPFVSWLRTSSPKAFWIQGKPGSGKSTLMKFAMRDQRTLDELRNNGSSWPTTAAFFFHDRGSEEVQKSLTGMLHPILADLLSNNSDLLDFVLPKYKQLCSEQRVDHKPNWTFQGLRECLMSCFGNVARPLSLLLFLDALDEHSGDHADLISLIKDLESVNNEFLCLKVCIASRPWTVFKQAFAQNPTFEIQNFTRHDIATYTRAEFEESGAFLKRKDTRNQLYGLVDQVSSKAQGVFIWVRVVVQQIADGLTNGTSLDHLASFITGLPESEDLSTLYKRTVERIEDRFLSEGFAMLAIVHCSALPMTASDLLRCIDSFSPQGISEYTREPQWRSTQVIRSPRRLPARKRPPAPQYRKQLSKNPLYVEADSCDIDVARLRIQSRTGGLLEVNSATNPPDQIDNDEKDDNLVQFLHQTVKDFVSEYFTAHTHEHFVTEERLVQGVSSRNGNIHVLSGLIVGHVYLANWLNFGPEASPVHGSQIADHIKEIDIRLNVTTMHIEKDLEEAPSRYITLSSADWPFLGGWESQVRWMYLNGEGILASYVSGGVLKDLCQKLHGNGRVDPAYMCLSRTLIYASSADDKFSQLGLLGQKPIVSNHLIDLDDVYDIQKTLLSSATRLTALDCRFLVETGPPTEWIPTSLKARLLEYVLGYYALYSVIDANSLFLQAAAGAPPEIVNVFLKARVDPYIRPEHSYWTPREMAYIRGDPEIVRLFEMAGYDNLVEPLRDSETNQQSMLGFYGFCLPGLMSAASMGAPLAHRHVGLNAAQVRLSGFRGSFGNDYDYGFVLPPFDLSSED